MSGIQGASMRSIRPYKSSEQYLYAMKEDLAEWLKELYDLEVDVGSFLEVLETGVLLCHHANNVTQLAREFRQEYPGLVHKLQLPTCGTTCNELAQPGTFQARDNVSNFIQWCRKEMDIKEVLMFETEDLVLRKNEKNFVLCLLEVARRASRFGMSAPTLIQMEEEIEDEIREDLNLPPKETPLPKPQRKPCSFKNLDQMVQCLVSRCTCPVQFSMIKVSEGKYRVGDSSTLIFVRILRNHVMVRVGGGWDTLQHYLDKHDPCRCTSLSHKQALKLASPQRMQVQHEITARLTPRTDCPSKPQPALIVSRSQSPPPPVEWRSYVPLSLGPGRTVVASSLPGDGRTGGGSSRRCPGLQSSHDPLEPRRIPSSRMRERSLTPSRRAPAAEESSGSQPTNSTQRGRETFSSQQNGNLENSSRALKTLPDPQGGRTLPVTVQATSPKERTLKLAPSGIAARRGEAYPPPRSTQKEGKSSQPSRSSSPAKLSGPSASQKAAKTPLDNSVMPQERGVTERGWRKDPIARQSTSPVKRAHQVHREDNSGQILGKVGLTSYRPLTPCKSDQGELCLRNSGLHLAKGQRERVLQNEMGPYEKQSQTFCPDTFSDKPRLEIGQLDSEQKRKGCQVLLGQNHVPRSKGSRGEPTVEKERVYTPLPINSAEEQALYRSLEDEILSNIKELEADDNHHPSTENQLGGFKTGKDAVAIGCNGPRLLISSLSSLQSGQKALYGEGVPRSGVYLPERAAQWHSAGLHYDSVIQELSRALHQECGEMERNWPPLSSALVNGNQVEKEILEREDSERVRLGVGPEGAEPSHTSQGGHMEVNRNGGSSQETPSGAANSPESAGVLEGAKLPQSKPRRTLKKPERVPSIYKLKLRPKIRPRRDNRPGKRPSKIPTPVAYRHAQRASGGRGQAKAHNSKHRAQACTAAGLRQNKMGHTGGEEEVALFENSTSSLPGGNSGEQMATAQGKIELTDDEESWV